MARLRGRGIGRAALLAVLAVAGAWLVLSRAELSGKLSVDNPRFPGSPWRDPGVTLPSVLRYRAGPDGARTAYGLVLDAPDGVPRRILNLTALHPELTGDLLAFHRGGGFAIARQRFSEFRAGWSPPANCVEELPRADLPERVLAPVGITAEDLAAGRRLVVGVWVNYAAHRTESGGEAADRFAFAKLVAPTGAYAPLRLPRSPPAPLTDYELEIGLVLLEDLDLNRLPARRADLLGRLAFVAANDVTDRDPIIALGDAGFTRGKSRPGYLPLGPWLVHGADLDLAAAGHGTVDLDLALQVVETPPHPAGSGRQQAHSAQMVRGPLEILRMLGEIYPASRRPDGAGHLRGIVREEGDRLLLPAGSVILTGTPAGTAIEAPTLWDRLRLLARANFSPAAARRRFADHCAQHREEMGFLKPGDRVQGRIQRLGTQDWVVGPPP